ncbi:MAG TPA: EVE domain-containing protein [Hyphomicrobiaceae bacterium]|nr:EVE domain-containing protein [Hyphomicrobiaceae bacterium]
MAKKPKAAPTPAGPPAVPAKRVDRWLLKSEPDVFSWAMMKSRGATGEPWTGVRNYLARNNMRSMQIGDLAFFYHSNIGKEIVGVVRVIALAHPDPEDETGTWACVDVAAVADLPSPVSLQAIKDNPKLSGMALVTTSRLSVQPVTPAEWREVCRMGGLDARRLAE